MLGASISADSTMDDDGRLSILKDRKERIVWPWTTVETDCSTKTDLQQAVLKVVLLFRTALMDKVAPNNAVMQNVLYEVDASNPDTRIRTIFWLFEAAKLFWKRIASVRLDGFKADNCAFVKTAQYIS